MIIDNENVYLLSLLIYTLKLRYVMCYFVKLVLSFWNSHCITFKALLSDSPCILYGLCPAVDDQRLIYWRWWRSRLIYILIIKSVNHFTLCASLKDIPSNYFWRDCVTILQCKKNCIIVRLRLCLIKGMTCF